MSAELDEAVEAYDELLDGERRAEVEALRGQIKDLREMLDDAQSALTEEFSKLADLEEKFKGVEDDLAADITAARARVDAAVWAHEPEPNDSASSLPAPEPEETQP